MLLFYFFQTQPEAVKVEERPQTVQGLSNEDIDSITDRVRKMPGR